jgi:hypothetical protein
MTDANQSFDARRMAKEQEGRMAASASIGFNAVKPFIQFQISMMRVFAENIDQMARNYEKSIETVSNVITQHGSESRREAASDETRSMKDSSGGFRATFARDQPPSWQRFAR